MEVSYSDTASGGIFEENYIPNLTRMAEDALDFGSKKEGRLNGAASWKYTTWTMGGMFAATSGLPLKIPVNREEAAFGAALYGTVCAGLYASLDDTRRLIHYEETEG